LQDVTETFRSYKRLSEKAFAQVSDAEFFESNDEENNSIAVIVKHVSGNLRSRWTDFLSSDGEKADRDRDAEFFTQEDETRERLIEFWESSWNTLFATLETLKPEDLEKTVKIRSEDYKVVKAINRAVTHAAYHVGQIVILAKHFRGKDWQNLSIPRNSSAEYNVSIANKTETTNYPDAEQNFSETKCEQG
jgi:uncharacterized damage-inducible protein DinB